MAYKKRYRNYKRKNRRGGRRYKKLGKVFSSRGGIML